VNKGLKKKKNLPKVIKKLPVEFKKFSKYTLVDYSLGVVIIKPTFS